MYVYLGGDAAVEKERIVGLFEMDNTSWSYLTREFLSRAEREGRVTAAGEDIPRSFVLCTDKKVILTQPSTAALVRRLEDQEKIQWQN